MKHSTRAHELFEKKPVNWGLRGDPYLWEALQERLATEGWPENQEALQRQLESWFRDITGGEVSAEKPLHVPHLDHGGMSSGMVSPSFWRETGFPHLLERYATLLGSPHRSQEAPTPTRRWIERLWIGLLVCSSSAWALYLWQHRAEIPLTIREAQERQEAKELAETIKADVQESLERGDVTSD